jgi:hypothetical protein
MLTEQRLAIRDRSRELINMAEIMKRNPIAYRRIADAARANADGIVRQWLPNGKRLGHEWTALNPRRDDRHMGSFRINLNSTRWCDFATNDRGGDLISLGAYLFRLSQAEAALQLAHMLGIEPNE